MSENITVIFNQFPGWIGLTDTEWKLLFIFVGAVFVVLGLYLLALRVRN